MPHLDSLEESLGVSFKERSLLRLAFVHSSYLNENPDQFPQSNERLEFLGDALIGWPPPKSSTDATRTGRRES